MSINTSDYMRHTASDCCAFHGTRKVWTRNIQIDGVALGEYQCPADGCEALPNYGDPMGILRQAQATTWNSGFTG